ncbi:MAG TPA: LptA/OstA family protein [Bauldia sp.]|nr:LptA/OstA family protein [Bauldia sp.]
MTGLRLLAFIAVLFAAAPAPALAQSAGDLFSGFGGKSKDPIEVDAASLEIYEEGEQRVSVFSGGVTVKRGNTTMKASVIKLVSDKNGENSSSFNTMEATGTVYVNSGEQTATGQRAFVDMKTQTITLTGDVVLSQGKNVIVGDKLVIDMKTGRAKVEQQNGKIRGVFSPETGKVGGDGAKPDGDGKKPPAKKPAKPAPAADTPTQ